METKNVKARETPSVGLDNVDHNIYDRRGIPIMTGDTLKVFHYVAAHRREKRYMYKFVEEVETIGKNKLLRISHLNLTGSYYRLLLDGKIDETIEIVQGYQGVESGQDYRDRPRKR